MKVCMNCHLTYDDAAQVCAQCGNPLVAVAPQQVDLFDHTAEFDAADISDNKVFAMLPYLMRYMGHNCIKHTLYYFRFVPDFYADYKHLSCRLNDRIPEVHNE